MCWIGGKHSDRHPANRNHANILAEFFVDIPPHFTYIFQRKNFGCESVSIGESAKEKIQSI